MEFTGVIKEALPMQSGTSKAGNQWAKQEFILEDNDQSKKYHDTIGVEVFGVDKIQAFGLRVGDVVTVQFSTSASTRTYTDKNNQQRVVLDASNRVWNVIRNGVDLWSEWQRRNPQNASASNGNWQPQPAYHPQPTAAPQPQQAFPDPTQMFQGQFHQ